MFGELFFFVQCCFVVGVLFTLYFFCFSWSFVPFILSGWNIHICNVCRHMFMLWLFFAIQNLSFRVFFLRFFLVRFCLFVYSDLIVYTNRECKLNSFISMLCFPLLSYFLSPTSASYTQNFLINAKKILILFLLLLTNLGSIACRSVSHTIWKFSIRTDA